MSRVLEVLNPRYAYMNPFVSQLITSLEPTGHHVMYWSYRVAFMSKYDVVHVHWPEHLYRGRSVARSALRVALLGLLIIMWKIKRIPVIWTVHNLAPHEQMNIAEYFGDKLFRRSVSLSVYLNDYDDVAPGLKSTAHRAVIKHGDYVNWMADYPRSASIEKRACLFGALRPYKGAEELITEFKRLPDDYSLTVCGKPLNSTYESVLTTLVGSDSRIDFLPGFHDDSDLVRIISESSLVVLPYKHMYNSGAAFLALSLDRPVLVPDNPHTRLLEKEFGSYWVRLYEGPINFGVLKRNLDKCVQRDYTSPNFEERRWPQLGRQYAELFERPRREPGTTFFPHIRRNH